MWVGGVTENDERENDYVIYDKTLTSNVLVDLLTDPSTRDVKVGTEMIWKTYQQRHILDDTGRDIEIITGQDTLFQEIRVTDTDVVAE
jgi:hypothetical protein